MENKATTTANGTSASSRYLAIVVALRPVCAWVMVSRWPDAYYISIQEDKFLEWLSFWGFFLAGLAYIHTATRQRKSGIRIPWFAFSVGLFCLFVAFEEISWGQRLMNLQPPEYFLEENFQQELNLHNVADSSLRMTSLMLVLVLFGVALPLMRLSDGTREFAVRVGVILPPVAVILPFAVAAVVYEIYPWDQTGEWVEMMAALGFLISGGSAAMSCSGDKPFVLFNPVSAFAVAVILSLANTWIPSLLGADDERIRQAQTEIQALAEDFRNRKVRVNCSVHKRIYTFVEEYGQDYLRQGKFSEIKQRGPGLERLDYFLDPWNSAYWVRHHCDPDLGRTLLILYSFGPNKRRDSSAAEILGDDLGAFVER